MTKKELQSLLEARTKALKKAEDRAEELKLREDVQDYKIMILTNVLKKIKYYAECNHLGNDDVFFRIIKELASTANQN